MRVPRRLRRLRRLAANLVIGPLVAFAACSAASNLLEIVAAPVLRPGRFLLYAAASVASWAVALAVVPAVRIAAGMRTEAEWAEVATRQACVERELRHSRRDLEAQLAFRNRLEVQVDRLEELRDRQESRVDATQMALDRLDILTARLAEALEERNSGVSAY